MYMTTSPFYEQKDKRLKKPMPVVPDYKIILDSALRPDT